MKALRSLLYAAIGLAVLIGFCAMLATELVRSREAEIGHARRNAENLALALEGQARATVQRIDQVLVEARYRLQPLFADGVPAAAALSGAVTADLTRWLGMIPEAQSLRVSGSDGSFVFDASGTVPTATIADRRFFIRQKEGEPDGGLVISEPVLSRTGGDWIIVLSRRLTDRNGHFAGLVQSGVPATFFETFYRTLGIGGQGSISFADADMKLIARQPPLPGRLGERIRNPALDRELQAHNSGTTIAYSYLDGAHRIYGYRRVRDLPFVILVGLSYDEVMAGWYAKAMSYALFAALLGAALSGLILVWQRNHSRAVRRVTDMSAAYAESASRMDALLDSIPDLAWIRDREFRFTAVNEAYAARLGLTRRAILGRTVQEIWRAPEAAQFHGQDIEVLTTGRRMVLDVIRVPVKDADGRITAIAGVSRDVTARKEAEEQRAENQILYRTLFEADNAVKLIVDPCDGRIVDANPAAVLFYGHARETFRSLTLDRIEDPDAAKGGPVTSHRLADGTVRQVEAHASPLALRGRDLMHMTVYDVTDREREATRQRLAAGVFRNIQEGIVITDSGNRIVDVNDAFTAITGYGRGEVIGKDPSVFKSGEQGADFYRDMWSALRKTGHWRGEIVNRRRDGALYTELLSITTVFDADGNLENYVAVFTDITTHKETEQQLQRLAWFDTLTQLPNRVLTADRLRQSIRQANQGGCLCAVCYLDLDDFKPINDEFGHACGDALLLAVASRLAARLHGLGSVGRLGGDEFAVILDTLSSRAACDDAVRRVLDVFSTPFAVADRQIAVTASIGVTLFPLDGQDADMLLRHADQAMHSAKQAGRNRCVVFDSERDRQTRSLHESRARIAAALEAGEFRLHYQPQVDLRAGRAVAVEALIRWQHPERGLLAPAAFLPQIEDSDLIVAIGDWVLEQAMRQVQEWTRAGLALSVGVNISARQLQQDGFVGRLRALLGRYPAVPAGRLELEILETSAFSDIAQICAVIEECRQFGVTFALDDFGTGYSSLSYLKRLPVQTLKIDQSFVRGMLDQGDDRTLVSAIIGLSKAFDRKVIAEGVEHAAIGAELVRLNCDLAQGYGIARPMAPELIPAWVRGFRLPDEWRPAARISRAS